MRVQRNSVFLYIGLLLVASSNVIIGLTYLFRITGLNPLTKFAAILCLMLAYMLGTYTKRELIGGWILLAICLAVTAVTDDNGFFINVLLIIVVYKEDPQTILRTIFLYDVIQIFMVMILTLCGVLQNEAIPHSNSSKIGHTMGFAYYSTPAYLIFFLTIIFYCIQKYNKCAGMYALVALVISYISYRITTVKLTFLLTILWIIMVLTCRGQYFRCHKKTITIIATVMYPAAMVASVVLPFIYTKSNILIHLDTALNGRLKFSRMGFERYSVKLFGNFIVTDSGTIDANGINHYFYIDSGYVTLLLGYGAIVTLLILTAYIAIARHAVRTNNTQLFLWCVIVCVFSLVNNGLINMIVNPLLIYGVADIYRVKRESLLGNSQYRNFAT